MEIGKFGFGPMIGNEFENRADWKGVNYPFKIRIQKVEEESQN
jgi:hypothetical protein